MRPSRPTAPVRCEHCVNPDKALWQTECRYPWSEAEPPCSRDKGRDDARFAWLYLIVPAIIVLALLWIGRANAAGTLEALKIECQKRGGAIVTFADTQACRWPMPDGVNRCYWPLGENAAYCTAMGVVRSCPDGIQNPSEADKELSDLNPCKPKDDLE